MAAIKLVQGFISIMALLLIIVFVNGIMLGTGVAGDFGMLTNDDMNTEVGFDTGMSQMTTLETEPNMLTSLSANIKYANSLRQTVNTVISAGSILTQLPLVPAWVSTSMYLLTIAGSATLWYLMTGKKV
tara:strand:+ start:1037 stop:1423 length:387 start_codon:yes stop_codon:yes gene_type:complete